MQREWHFHTRDTYLHYTQCAFDWPPQLADAPFKMLYPAAKKLGPITYNQGFHAGWVDIEIFRYDNRMYLTSSLVSDKVYDVTNTE